MSVYEGIMEGLGEALAHAEGRRALRTTPVFEPVRDYRPDEIKQLRTGLGMTQVVFAVFLGGPRKRGEAGGAGGNRPEGRARRLFALRQSNPRLPDLLKRN